MVSRYAFSPLPSTDGADAAQNKQLDTVKGASKAASKANSKANSKATSTATSRAASVVSTGSAGKGKGSKGKKK